MLMKIIIQTLLNKKLCISLNSNDKIKTIKNKIQENEGIPSDQQYLIFGGNKLEDEHFISDYNITENSKIYLVLRLRGGSKAIKDEPINIKDDYGRIFRQEKYQLDNKKIDLQLKNESKEKEKREEYFFKFLYQDKIFNFSYDGNLTVKEMLTDFLNRIGSKETPEEMCFMSDCYILNNKRFSKKIHEVFKYRNKFIIKVREQGGIIGGNK